MFGIGMQELIIIGIVALLIVGPKKLPELARSLGKGFAEFKKTADDISDGVKSSLKEEKITHQNGLEDDIKKTDEHNVQISDIAETTKSLNKNEHHSKEETKEIYIEN
ncbi:MAG: Sec-independent protein translocase protein TatB [Deltaproteobacteria bacterium]